MEPPDPFPLTVLSRLLLQHYPSTPHPHRLQVPIRDILRRPEDEERTWFWARNAADANAPAIPVWAFRSAIQDAATFRYRDSEPTGPFFSEPRGYPLIQHLLGQGPKAPERVLLLRVMPPRTAQLLAASLDLPRAECYATHRAIIALLSDHAKRIAGR